MYVCVYVSQLRSSGYHMLNFIAMDLQLYKTFKTVQVPFFETHCKIDWTVTQRLHTE